MTKEQEVIDYLDAKIFNPILHNPTAPEKIKSGIRITKARMGKLPANTMVQYFWSALATDNGIAFSKHIKAEGLTRFEDILEDFRERFGSTWLKKP